MKKILLSLILIAAGQKGVGKVYQNEPSAVTDRNGRYKWLQFTILKNFPRVNALVPIWVNMERFSNLG